MNNLINKNNTKKLLILVLPFIVESIFAKGVKTRSFLAFPYGPLTIASYIKKKNPDHKVKILDLNGIVNLSKLPSREELLSEIVSLIGSPGSTLSQLIGSPGSNIAGIVTTVEEKKAAWF